MDHPGCFSGGALPAPAMKRPFTAAPPSYSEADTQSVDQIKQMQRNDSMAREQWWAYCDSAGGGVRDPAKHTTDFLQTFIGQYKGGARFAHTAPGLPAVALPVASSLLGMVKEGQRKSQHFRAAWAAYCDTCGGGTHDPSKHDEGFHVAFLDFLGQYGNMAILQAAQGAGMAGGMAGGMAASMTGGMAGGMAGQGYLQSPAFAGAGLPQAKRQRIGGPSSMMGVLPSTGGEKDALVQEVKNYQRSGEEAKEAWWAFCDQHMGGVRDPARHEVDSLKGFLESYGVGGAASVMASLHGGQSAPQVLGGQAEKEQLVHKVKGFQRVGQDQKELWWTFCDHNSSGVRDPARHDAGSLRSFLESHGVG